MFRQIFQQLNFAAECRRYGLSLWQCPSFLIILNGLITIMAMVGTYLVAAKYTEPNIVALIVIIVTAILIIISYFFINGFERLAESNRLKTEFVSIASHQLRTPLTGIKWAIQLMLKGRDKIKDLTPEQLEELRGIKENNQRMIDLVNDLLNVSRIEQGKLMLKPERVSLTQTIAETIEEYAHTAKASNVNLFFQAEPNLPAILIDPQAIKLVVHNLIDNAIRYCRGKGQVQIRLIKKDKIVRCEIEDNGVGIPKADQKKIFQKFFRSDNALKYQTEGTGLGLFISKAIIDESRGKIGFQSQENKGSIFWFELTVKL